MISAMENDIVFNHCLRCKEKFNVYDLQTKKHIDDIHNKYICAKCSDLTKGEENENVDGES